MTTETTAFMIGYGFFLLITALLTFAWKKDQKLCQELLKENNELTEAKENAIKSIYNSRAEVESIGIDLIQVRRDFIEQSELATEWRQKHDKVSESCSSLYRINSKLIQENNNLESELDRGNEMIAWMKADLESLLAAKRRMEMICAKLIQTTYFRDGSRFRPIADVPETLDWVGELFGVVIKDIKSLEDFLDKSGVILRESDRIKYSFLENLKNWNSKLLQNIDNAGEKLEERFNEVFDFPNSIPKDETNANETITVEDFLKSPDLATGHMKSVIEIKPDEPLHDFEKIADQATQPLANAIDWTVPQRFPKDYLIPINTDVVAIDSPKMVGKTTEKSSVPFCKWSYGATSIAIGFELAPINPTDHPLHPEFGKQPSGISGQFDHPCLTGCSNKTNCTCSPADPRDGKVLQVYTRAELIDMGLEMAIMNTKSYLQGEVESLNEFALKNDLFYIGSNYGVTFNFYRKAKNEDFESWGKKDISLGSAKKDIENSNDSEIALRF